MKGVIFAALIFASIVLFPHTSFASTPAPSISVSSTTPIQGNPVLVTFDGVYATSSIKSILFNGVPVGTFLYRGKVYALVGIDLHKKPGVYTLSAQLSDGKKLEKNINITERPQVTAPLGIPAKLGGNTAVSQAALVSTLASENASLANIRTGTKAFWTENFQWPLKNIVVTDPYGYARQTGVYSIAHKGADFRAAEGTPVTAINRGVVRVVHEYRDYGKTIVVDHGLGLMSFYMHLSKINVNAGQLVLPGQVIAFSGQTGYAAEPHLHLTIRINGVSIDPMIFFSLFK